MQQQQLQLQLNSMLQLQLNQMDSNNYIGSGKEKAELKAIAEAKSEKDEVAITRKEG